MYQHSVVHSKMMKPESDSIMQICEELINMNFFHCYNINEIKEVLQTNSDNLICWSNNIVCWVSSIEISNRSPLTLSILSTTYNNEYLTLYELLGSLDLRSGLVMNTITYLYRLNLIKFHKTSIGLIPEVEVSITETGKKKFENFLYAFFNIQGHF